MDSWLILLRLYLLWMAHAVVYEIHTLIDKKALAETPWNSEFPKFHYESGWIQ